MRVLVTGSEGYIGTVLARYLVDRGHDVVGLDTGYYRTPILYDDRRRAPPTITADIRDISAAEFPAVDAVVHLAELSNDPLGEMDPEVTWSINHAGSLRICELARQRGASRFVYASSCSVYGVSDDWCDESSAVAPVTQYARCKVAVERDLLVQTSSDFCPIALRFATAFGASPRQRFDIVLNDLVGRALTEECVTLLGDGRPWRPFVHVADICAAIGEALAAPRDAVAGQVVNVGADDCNVTLADLARSIAAAFGGLPVRTLARDKDARSYRVRFARIRQILPGFRPQWTIARGIAELAAVVRDAALTAEQFEGPSFRRLPRLKRLRAENRVDASLRWERVSKVRCRVS